MGGLRGSRGPSPRRVRDIWIQAPFPIQALGYVLPTADFSDHTPHPELRTQISQLLPTLHFPPVGLEFLQNPARGVMVVG